MDEVIGVYSDTTLVAAKDAGQDHGGAPLNVLCVEGYFETAGVFCPD